MELGGLLGAKGRSGSGIGPSQESAKNGIFEFGSKNSMFFEPVQKFLGWGHFSGSVFAGSGQKWGHFGPFLGVWAPQGPLRPNLESQAWSWGLRLKKGKKWTFDPF